MARLRTYFMVYLSMIPPTPGALSLTPGMLTLLVALCWCVNALSHQPYMQMKTYRQLRRAMLGLERVTGEGEKAEDESDEEPTHPDSVEWEGYGIFFFGDVLSHTNDGWAVIESAAVQREAVAVMCSQPGWVALIHACAPQGQRQQNRLRDRHTSAGRREGTEGAPRDGVFRRRLVNTKPARDVEGVAFRVPLTAAPAEGREEGDAGRAATGLSIAGEGAALNARLATLFNRFAPQLLKKVPVVRNQSASRLGYRLVLPGQESLHNNGLFEDCENIKRVFRYFQVKDATEAEWIQTYRRFFPTIETTLSPHAQGFTSMAYWLEWREIAAEAGHSAKAIEEQGLEHFNRFKWVPMPDADRLFNTKRHPHYKCFQPLRLEAPGYIRVLLSPRFLETPQWIGAATVGEENFLE